MTERLGLAQSTVSGHYACLRDCGLVTSRPVGRATRFSLTWQSALRRLLASADALLDAGLALYGASGEGAGPPAGWNNPFQEGTLTLETEARALFEARGEQVVLKPSPSDEPIRICR